MYRDAYLQQRPDWVMLGMPLPDGNVAIIASRSLLSAELATETDHEEVAFGFGEPLRRYLTSQITTVSAAMTDFVYIVGPDYPTVMSNLAEHWQPKRAERRELPGRRALPPALPGPTVVRSAA